MARAFRFLVKVALLAAVLWWAKKAWTRWVEGPPARQDAAPWPPVGGAPVGVEQPPVAAPGAGPEAAAPPTEAAAAPAPEAAPPSPAKKAAPPAPEPPAKRPPAKKAAKAAQGRIVPTKRQGPAKKAASSAPDRTRVATARIVPATKKPNRSAGRRTWVRPEADGCPTSHPVKAKVTSMIYHLPGMASYARTAPDRCYATPEAAEADGFARAKR